MCISTKSLKSAICVTTIASEPMVGGSKSAGVSGANIVNFFVVPSSPVLSSVAFVSFVLLLCESLLCLVSQDQFLEEANRYRNDYLIGGMNYSSNMIGCLFV